MIISLGVVLIIVIALADICNTGCFGRLCRSNALTTTTSKPELNLWATLLYNEYNISDCVSSVEKT